VRLNIYSCTPIFVCNWWHTKSLLHYAYNPHIHIYTLCFCWIFTDQVPFCCPTSSVKSLMGTQSTRINWENHRLDLVVCWSTDSWSKRLRILNTWLQCIRNFVTVRYISLLLPLPLPDCLMPVSCQDVQASNVRSILGCNVGTGTFGLHCYYLSLYQHLNCRGVNSKVLNFWNQLPNCVGDIHTHTVVVIICIALLTPPSTIIIVGRLKHWPIFSVSCGVLNWNCHAILLTQCSLSARRVINWSNQQTPLGDGLKVLLVYWSCQWNVNLCYFVQNCQRRSFWEAALSTYWNICRWLSCPASHSSTTFVIIFVIV